MGRPAAGSMKHGTETLPAVEPAGRVDGRHAGAWVVGQPTLHGGPVVLLPVRATPCFAINATIQRKENKPKQKNKKNRKKNAPDGEIYEIEKCQQIH